MSHIFYISFRIHSTSSSLSSAFYLSTDSIQRANMDGFNLTTLVTNVTNPAGIAVDDSRIYWADHLRHSIESSDLDGCNVQTVVQLQSGSYPWGLVLHDDRIYWGTWGKVGAIQSVDKGGKDLCTHYEGLGAVQHLALVTSGV